MLGQCLFEIFVLYLSFESFLICLNFFSTVFEEGGIGGAITADGWKDTFTQTDFFGVSVHYFVGWDLTARILLMTEYDTDKTADKIRNFFDFQLEKYNITEEMRSRAVVVSDAASNMVRAFKAFDKSETMER